MPKCSRPTTHFACAQPPTHHKAACAGRTSFSLSLEQSKNLSSANGYGRAVSSARFAKVNMPQNSCFAARFGDGFGANPDCSFQRQRREKLRPDTSQKMAELGHLDSNCSQVAVFAAVLISG
jgi:hypothetical protein